MILSDSVTIKQNLPSEDTPILSDDATVALIYNLTTDDSPLLSESLELEQTLVPEDIPTLSDSATVGLLQSISTEDTPGLSDSATIGLIQGLVTEDNPNLTESVIFGESLFSNDSPLISDEATIFLIQGSYAVDEINILDYATLALIQGMSTHDEPSISDSAELRQELFPNDIPSLNELANVQLQTPLHTGGGGNHLPPSIGSSSLVLLENGLPQGANQEVPLDTSRTTQIKVREKFDLKFDVTENGGINHLEHATLYFGRGDSGAEVSQSSTFIRFEKGKPFEISDPDKVFADVSLALLTNDSTHFTLNYEITFAKPMDLSSILMRLWDLDKNAVESWYYHAIEVIDDTTGTDSIGPKNQPDDPTKHSTLDQRQELENWSQNSISDGKLLQDLGIVKNETDHDVKIPSWFKENLSNWVLQDKVSFTEFVEALKYMSDKGILLRF